MSDLPYAKSIDTYTCIKVYSTELLHDSGHRILRVIGEKEDKSCYLLADSADVIYWTFINDNPWWMPRKDESSMMMDSDGTCTDYYGARFVVEPSEIEVSIKVHHRG